MYGKHVAEPGFLSGIGHWPTSIIDRDKPEELFGRHAVSETIANRTGYTVKTDAYSTDTLNKAMDSMAQERYIFQRTVEVNLTKSFLELLRTDAKALCLNGFKPSI